VPKIFLTVQKFISFYILLSKTLIKFGTVNFHIAYSIGRNKSEIRVRYAMHIAYLIHLHINVTAILIIIIIIIIIIRRNNNNYTN
jgi:hypothetical protein